MAILVDSSVWIAAADARKPECLELRRLIVSPRQQIYVCRQIQVEVCQGARAETDFHRLWEAFLGFDFLDATDRIWGLSAWNYYRCRKKGLTIGTVDCLIATLARENNLPLWTLDRSLKKSASILGFDLFKS